MVKIYNYDKNTKEFLSEGIAQENPKRKGEYLLPAYSTRVVPPALNINEAVVFNGEFWDIVPDFRGVDAVNLDTKEIVKIDYLGNLKEGFLLYSDYLKTEEYKSYLKEAEKSAEKNRILEEINEIDLKRIRAVCEPSVKDSSTGETWLEFYNSKIRELRQMLAEVDDGN